MSLVKLTNINKIYQGEGISFQALYDINISIKQGEFVAIIGPSGSGKSTLMHLLGLLDKPTTGSYYLDGQNVEDLSENTLAKIRNQKIGFIFQSFNLLRRTTSLDNVCLPLIYAGISPDKRQSRAIEALKEVGLEEKLKSLSNQLSGGQQQRVAIARALVTDPQIILADEPTGNLDTKTSLEIMKLLEDLHAKGRTIILITHEPDIAKYAERTITIKDGRIEN